MSEMSDKDEISAPPPSLKSEARPTEPVVNGHSESLGSIEAERNTIFDSLVKVEGEVSGLVAYSIYKQNKRSWLNDFQKVVGRPPNEAETRAYIIGESTDRRLATYRHLAQATLAGQGPAEGSRGGLSRSGMFYLVWAAVLIVAVVVLGYALRSGLPVAK